MSPAPTDTTDTGLTCEAAGIVDPNSAAWEINGLTWAPGGRADDLEIALELIRPSAANASQVSIEVIDPAEVIDVYGIAGPVTSRALVVTFSRPFGLSFVIDETPDLDAIREVTIAEGRDALIHAIIGLEGNGCHRLSAPDWEAGTPPAKATVIVSVRR